MDFHSAHRVKPSKGPIALTCVPPSSLNGLTFQVRADVYTWQGRAWPGWAGQLVSRLVPTCRALPQDSLHDCIVTQDAPEVHEDFPALQKAPLSHLTV